MNDILVFPRPARKPYRKMPLANQPPILLHHQPKPTTVVASVIATSDGERVTGIARSWAKGDSARCRLCRDCSAVGDVCIVVTTAVLRPGEAALFDSTPYAFERVEDRVRVVEG